MTDSATNNVTLAKVLELAREKGIPLNPDTTTKECLDQQIPCEWKEEACFLALVTWLAERGIVVARLPNGHAGNWWEWQSGVWKPLPAATSFRAALLLAATREFGGMK